MTEVFIAMIIITAIVLFMKYIPKGKRMMGLTVLTMMTLVLVACSNDSPNNDLNDTDKEEATESTETADDEINQSQSEKLNGMEVHFIDVGQADAALIQYDSYSILIDAGDWQGNEVVPYLKKANVDELDLLVGSHPHADHIGQFDKVMDEFAVEEVWMSGGTNTSQLFDRVINAIDKSGANYEEPRTGDVYEIGDLKIEVLSPTSLTGDLNDDSIVMKLTYGDVSFLFTGDAEKKAEASMVSSGQDLSATILKSGHHGSDTSNTQAFVDKVSPEVVVISAAKKSKYNHPNKSVVDRFNSMGVDLYATKTHGNIVIKTDGKTYDVTADSNGEVIPGDVGAVTKEDNKVDSKETKEPAEKKTNDKPKSSSGCVDINEAGLEELQDIKHIGEERAKEIISKRENSKFESVDGLSSIKGIGNGVRLSEIKGEGIACVK